MTPWMASITRSDLTARLAEISEYLAGLGDHPRCGKHPRVVHWGKLAYGLVIDGFLARETGRALYLDRGLRRMSEVLVQLSHHDGHWVFYPGLLNPANASNNAIDSGTVVDSLGEWCGLMAEHTPRDLLDRAREACIKVAESYLPNTLDKPTNQALWAMTGLASAWRFVDSRERWREVCLLCLERSFADQWDDGSFPYLPERMRGIDHPSLHDLSGYYHSRHVAFILHVARLIDHVFSDAQRAALVRAGDILAALYGPDGRKNLEVEAKHWYWMVPGRFETASAPFDLNAFASLAELRSDEEFRRGAAWAARAFVDARARDGSVINLGKGLDFQCTHFWTGHSAWVARALDRGFEPEPPGLPRPGVFAGRDSGIVTVTTDHWHLQLRSRRSPLSPLFGAYAAGAVQGLYHLAGTADINLLERDRFSTRAPGEFFLSGGASRWRRPGLAARSLWRDRRQYRFGGALVRDALRVGTVSRALRIMWTTAVRQARFLNGALHSSFWPLTSTIEVQGSRVEVRSSLARADGSSWFEVPVEKTYHLEPAQVRVELTVSGIPRSGRLRWIPPMTVTELEIEGASHRRRAGAVVFAPEAGRLRLRCSILPRDG